MNVEFNIICPSCNNLLKLIIRNIGQDIGLTCCICKYRILPGGKSINHRSNEIDNITFSINEDHYLIIFDKNQLDCADNKSAIGQHVLIKNGAKTKNFKFVKILLSKKAYKSIIEYFEKLDLLN